MEQDTVMTTDPMGGYRQITAGHDLRCDHWTRKPIFKHRYASGRDEEGHLVYVEGHFRCGWCGARFVENGIWVDGDPVPADHVNLDCEPPCSMCRALMLVAAK
jgi:hypothetical protein